MRSLEPRLGGLQIVIIVLTIGTALIHFFLQFPNIVSILNGLGYLGLLAVLYLPIPACARRRGLARVLLMAFAAVTIVAWIGLGEKNLSKGYIAYVGYADKIIEMVLIILLWLENQRSKARHAQ